jgi:16S rRNA processing protein RimM
VSKKVDVLVGKVGRAHGIRGDVTVDVRTDEPDRRFAAGTAFTTGRGRLTVVSTQWHSGRLLVRFDEVPDRTTAESLRGTELRIEVDPDERPDDPDEFYDHQLVGLTVESETGERWGEVSEVLHLPAQDLLVVRRSTPDTNNTQHPGDTDTGDAAGADVMVPFVTEFVPTVDLTGRRLVVTDRAGLLADEEPGPASETG